MRPNDDDGDDNGGIPPHDSSVNVYVNQGSIAVLLLLLLLVMMVLHCHQIVRMCVLVVHVFVCCACICICCDVEIIVRYCDVSLRSCQSKTPGTRRITFVEFETAIGLLGTQYNAIICVRRLVIIITSIHAGSGLGSDGRSHDCCY